MDAKHTPDYIFEASWEVCNKVGGIYTVLSTKANSLQKLYKDKVFFIGPDILQASDNPWFLEEKELYADWRNFARINQNLEIRAGRWNVPGNPIVFLIKFDRFFEQKNSIYSEMWLDFGVDSMYAYGDYDESSMFAYASGVVIESFYRFHRLEACHVIAHFDEWQLGMGALYIKKYVPKIATVFTTHATGVGRSIAGNGLPLYNHLKNYNG
ncbi:MAG TPA: glycogen/starch synthase, partial [Petrimonas sp.]|nr:glycogen/starch synthase [Petrimonas sp.]